MAFELLINTAAQTDKQGRIWGVGDIYKELRFGNWVPHGYGLP